VPVKNQIRLEIVGLTDEASVQRATDAIRNNSGVERALVQLKTRSALVDVVRGYTLEHILESLESAGFMARPAEDD
jgi:cation transport ATPase